MCLIRHGGYTRFDDYSSLLSPLPAMRSPNTLDIANLQLWELKFRAAAKADKYVMLRDHLRRFGFPERPKLLLEGTVQVVRACCAYAAIDQRSFSEFLMVQQYDPSAVADAKYLFTFDIYGKAFGRVLVRQRDFTGRHYILDLADLYGQPWKDYKRCGYSSLWIIRSDGRRLGRKELRTLEQQVTYDLRFDYSEAELDFWFDDLTVEGTMRVDLLDNTG